VNAVASFPKKQAQAVIEKSACVDKTYAEMLEALKESGYDGKLLSVKNASK